MSVERTINLAVALLITAALLPTSLLAIAMVDTTGWNPAVATIFHTLLPILAVVGIVYGFFYFGRRRGSMQASRVIQIAVALLVIASIFPIAISNIVSMQTATTVTSGTETITYTIPPSVRTLTQVLIPILAVVAVAAGFMFVRGFRR